MTSSCKTKYTPTSFINDKFNYLYKQSSGVRFCRQQVLTIKFKVETSYCLREYSDCLFTKILI